MLQRIRNAIWALRQSPNISLEDLDGAILSSFDFGGQETTSGVLVSEQSAVRQSTVFSCINILSRDMAALPLKLYERKADGGRSEVASHPVSEWLRRPNQGQTPMQYRQLAWFTVLANGNQFHEVTQSPMGGIETIPMDPNRMKVGVTSRFRKVYTYQQRDGTKKTFSPDRIFHHYGISADGVRGISPIRQCMESIGRAIAVGEYGAAYFRSPVPKIIINHPTGFKSAEDAETFRTMWREKFAGPKGLANVAVLPDGMTVGQIVKIPNNEAQFIETQRLSKEEIAQIYLVPLHRLQSLERATFSNIEHQDLEYVKYTLMPWLTGMEQAIEAQFLTPDERQRLFVRHNLDGLLRGDFKTRQEGYASAIQWSNMTPNEARALENKPAVEGGDDLLVPMNMTRLKDLAAAQEEPDGPEPTAPDSDDESDDDDTRDRKLNRAAGIGLTELRAVDARRSLVRRTSPRLAAVLRSEVQRLANAVQKEGLPKLRAENRDAALFLEWLEQFLRSRTDAVRAAARPILLALAAEVAAQAAGEVDFEYDADRIAAEATRFVENFGERWERDQLQELVAAVADGQGEPDTEVSSVLSRWLDDSETDDLADQEAGHQTNSLANQIARGIFVAAGFRLVWATFGGKNCPYCRSLRGRRVSGRQDFLGAGPFQPDGASRPLSIRRGIKHPPVHKGCVCQVVPG
jgi:HK97 family phage portal protein